MTWNRQSARPWDTLAIVFLGVWQFIYYWPATVGQKVFTDSDILEFFLPVHTELARALAEGRLPLWTVGIQAGFPLYAEGQVAGLHPLNLALHLLLPLPAAISYTILVNRAWACIGMYLLCRVSGFSRAGAVLAGLVFGASGFMTAHAPHITLVGVASWLPWLLLFQQKFWHARWEGKRTVGWFLLICVSIGLQFMGGFPYVALLDIAILVLFAAFASLVWGSPEGGRGPTWITISMRRLPRTMLITVLAVILGTGLAAVQLLPMLELTGLSSRASEVEPAFFSSYSLDPRYLLQFALPLGSLGLPYEANVEFWGYLGVLPLFLALLAPFLRRDARTRFFFILALLSLSLAWGEHNPFYGWLHYIPVFNRFRVPARFLLLFAFAAAFLAATGFDELCKRLRNPSKLERASLLLGAAFATLILFTISLAYSQPPDFWMDKWALLPACLALLSVGAFIVARLRLVTRPVFGVFVLGLTIFDLAAFSAPFLASLDHMTPTAEVMAVPRTVQEMDNDRTLYRVLSSRSPLVKGSSKRDALSQNIALLYGKQSAKGYTPLGLRRNEEYVGDMSSGMRNLMNIRYYLSPREPLPWASRVFHESELQFGLSPALLDKRLDIPPTRVARIEAVSYTDRSEELPDGFLAGEIVLTQDSGALITLPIRLGYDTGDWAYNGITNLGKVHHSMPASALSFPAYLSSVGREFQGHKYVARYDVAPGGRPLSVTAVGVRSFLSDAALNIESISLIDEAGHSVSLASLVHQNDLGLVFRSNTAAMWESHEMLPRAFVVYAAEVVKDEQVLARLREPDFRPDRVVLLSDGQSIDDSDGSLREEGKDQVAVADYRSDRVVVQVKTDTSGYLVLTDSWYPGWMAWVDGRSVPIHRADYVFRAVLLSPGQHVVVFEYRPASIAWGAVISGLSLLVCAFIAIAAHFRPTIPGISYS